MAQRKRRTRRRAKPAPEQKGPDYEIVDDRDADDGRLVKSAGEAGEGPQPGNAAVGTGARGVGMAVDGDGKDSLRANLDAYRAEEQRTHELRRIERDMIRDQIAAHSKTGRRWSVAWEQQQDEVDKLRRQVASLQEAVASASKKNGELEHTLETYRQRRRVKRS